MKDIKSYFQLGQLLYVLAMLQNPEDVKVRVKNITPKQIKDRVE